MILSILIPSTFDRQGMLESLLFILNEQIKFLAAEDKVEIITDIDNREKSIGIKRNDLLNAATGTHIIYIDSDDEVSDDYIYEILSALLNNPDVVTFNGFMTYNLQNRQNFKIAHGLPYVTITDGNGNKEHLRHPNHLTAIRRSIALQIGFKDLRFAEDYDFALRLKESNLIKTSHYIQKDLYHYKYNPDKV